MSKSLSVLVLEKGLINRQWARGAKASLLSVEAAASVQVSRLRRQRVTRLSTERLKWRAEFKSLS